MGEPIRSTPMQDGFFMPAEWAPHARCWMAWPCRVELWREGFDAACLSFARIARAIASFEPVTVLTPEALVAVATLQLARKAEVRAMVLDDSWTRDAGPQFLIDGNGNLAGLDWRFNGWGNRFHPYQNDDALPATICDALDLPRYLGPMVCEGGALDVDGAGTVLTTEPVLLNDNRNPTLDRQQVEQRLATSLGIAKVIWLPFGLSGDQTDGHVDNIARFIGPAQVICAIADDPADPDRDNLNANRDLLAGQRDALGRPLQIVELPQPHLRRDSLAPASYVNFYIANGGIVMPSFDDPMDGLAREIIEAAFPERSVLQLPARDIIAGGGGIHCITQQQPAVA